MPEQFDKDKVITDKTSRLIKLAKEETGSITESEKKLFIAVVKGKIADYSTEAAEDNDPAKARNWGNERVLNAKIIIWLCTDPQASALVTNQGIAVKGARIDGKLNMSYARCLFPLNFKKSKFTDEINLAYAEITALNLEKTHTGPINAEAIKVRGDVFLCDGFKAEGKVRMTGASIWGNLECDKGKFINPNGNAIYANNLNVRGDVFLCDGFKAEGEVRMIGASIGGNLQCNKGQFISPEGTALIISRVDVMDNLLLCDGFKAEGEVRMINASIGGNFRCDKGQFVNPNGIAIYANNLNVRGDVFLSDGFKAKGEVRMTGASIGGNLQCDKCQFINPDGVAISADNSNIKGDLFLCNDFKAEGEVRMIGALIGGNLQCDKCQCINPEGTALDVSRVNVMDNLFLCECFKAEGEVRMIGASIGGSFDCKKGQFINPNGVAIYANNLNVSGDVFLDDGFSAKGTVRLANASIAGMFKWVGILSPTDITLDLRSARIGTIFDDQRSWPRRGKLLLSGLLYDNIHENAPIRAKVRIDWLRRHSTQYFTPQPYEQLAALLKKYGHESDAKEILIAKSKDRTKYGKLTLSEWLWYHIFGRIIGYGYRPWRAFIIGLIVIALGWGFFGMGFYANLIIPTNEWAYVSNTGNLGRLVSEDYPKFQPLVYSLDVFVPVIDFQLANYWMPNAYRQGKLLILNRIKIPFNGSALRIYKWLHIIAGWVLTTLWVVGLTGVIKS